MALSLVIHTVLTEISWFPLQCRLKQPVFHTWSCCAGSWKQILPLAIPSAGGNKDLPSPCRCNSDTSVWTHNPFPRMFGERESSIFYFIKHSSFRVMCQKSRAGFSSSVNAHITVEAQAVWLRCRSTEGSSAVTIVTGKKGRTYRILVS